MPAAPLFSVVIPAHNGKERLAATLDSIAASDFDLRQVEVIVVDDGSSDGTFEAFDGREFPFAFRIERGAYSSQSRTTNEAIKLARGTYVLSSAQDILFDPGMFKRHLAAHERGGGADTTVLGSLPYPPQLEVTAFMFYLVSGGYQFAYFLIHDHYNVPPNFLYAPNFSIRRDVLERVGWFDEDFPYGCQDTDLAFRLVDAGVRLVYEPMAIGYHNHPIEIDSYCKRQLAVGRSMFDLERKHPDYEGGPAYRDMALGQYLLFSDVRLDQARQEIEKSLPLLERDEHRGYQALWNRTFCNGNGSKLTLDSAENETFVIVRRLFEAFHGILGFHFARGYFERALEVEGRDTVEAWVRRRMNKGQASVQLRRTLRHRLAEHGIDWEACGRRDYRVSRVVTDLPDYTAAIDYLDPFQNPPAAMCNYQLVLVLDRRSFSPGECERLANVAEVVADDDRDRGVLRALKLCDAKVVTITSSTVEPVHAENELLVDQLFERIPALSVLSGGIETTDGKRLCGHEAGGAPLLAEFSYRDGMIAVDAPIREYCFLRGSVLERLLAHNADLAGNDAWHQELGARVRREGQQVWHVPDLDVRAREKTFAIRAGAGV